MMGFTTARSRLIASLQNNTYQHDTKRSKINAKNLLLTGKVTGEEICKVVKRSRGQHYSSSPHHHDPSIEVHVIERDGWYLKFYFVNPDTALFISVHH